MTNHYGSAPTEKMLTPATLAEMLDISDRHLTDVRREDETFPSPVLLGTSPRWSPAVIRRWMERDMASCCTCDNKTRTATPAIVNTPKGTKKAKGAQRVH
jgi:predicted DNA-binding transcriptional regulator AlpA